MVDMVTYDPDKIPGYGDVCGYDVEGDCCEPDICPGDVLLVSREAVADLGAGGYAVIEHPTGKRLCKRVEGYDGTYWSLTNNYGHRFGCMDDFMLGAIVGVVRGGETRALALS